MSNEKIRILADAAGIKNPSSVTLRTSPEEGGYWCVTAVGWPWPSGRPGDVEECAHSVEAATAQLLGRARRLAESGTDCYVSALRNEVKDHVEALLKAQERMVKAEIESERRRALLRLV